MSILPFPCLPYVHPFLPWLQWAHSGFLLPPEPPLLSLHHRLLAGRLPRQVTKPSLGCGFIYQPVGSHTQSRQTVMRTQRTCSRKAAKLIRRQEKGEEELWEGPAGERTLPKWRPMWGQGKGEGRVKEIRQRSIKTTLSPSHLLRAGSATQLLKCATKQASSSSQLLPLHTQPLQSASSSHYGWEPCEVALQTLPLDFTPAELKTPPHHASSPLSHELPFSPLTPVSPFSPFQINVIHLQNTNGDPCALTQSFLLVLISYLFYNYSGALTHECPD